MVDVDQVSVIPRVVAGFHQRLKANVVVQGKTFVELQNFHRVSYLECLERQAYRLVLRGRRVIDRPMRTLFL